jgi:hypothetical protein
MTVPPATAGTDGWHLAKVITGPGIPPVNPPGGEWCTDVNYVSGHRYYLADASNQQIDVVNTRTGQLLAPIGHGDFTGPGGCTSFDFSQEGPQGIIVVRGQVWAGNGDSTVHVYQAATGHPVAVVNTGGTRRADEIAYDARDGLVLVTNPDEVNGQPFLTLISARTRQIVRRFRIPGATSLEQPVWNPADGMFYVSVPATVTLPGGEIAVINPRLTHPAAGAFPAGDCSPGGLAISVRTQTLALGCGNTAALMRISDGTMTLIPQITGTDEVQYNGGLFYFGSFAGQAVGIVSARTGAFITNIPAGTAGFHAAAADGRNLFVPETGTGIAVFRRDPAAG